MESDRSSRSRSSSSSSISSSDTLAQSEFIGAIEYVEEFLNESIETSTTLIENFSTHAELYKVCKPTDPHFKSVWEAAGLPATKVFFGDFVKYVTVYTLENFDESVQLAIRNSGGWFAYLQRFLDGDGARANRP